MPNVRTSGQTMIGTWCDDAFIRRIDAARTKLSLTRSQFCREALAEKLGRMGINVGDVLTTAPDRTGKGGPQKRYPIGHMTHEQLNEVSSKAPDPIAEAAEASYVVRKRKDRNPRS